MGKGSSNQSFDWNFIIEEAKNLIASDDIISMQYLLNELNEFLINFCMLLEQDFSAVEDSKQFLSLQVCRPFSETYSSQTNEIFFGTTDNFFLVPKNNADSKDLINKDFMKNFDFSELCETKLDLDHLDDVKEEVDEDEFNGVEKKKRQYKLSAYDESFPITKEKFDEMIAKGSPFVCPACNISKLAKSSMIRHLHKSCKGVPMVWPKWKKISPNEFSCDIEGCSQSSTVFKSYDQIKTHHYNVHAPQAKKIHKCEYCGKDFTNSGNLAHHVKLVHNPEGEDLFSHVCRFCAKQFKSKKGMEKHEMVHTNKKPEACPHCEFRCISKSSLRRHIAGVHDFSTQEICDICGKSFNTKLKLKQHILNHSDISEKCPICGKMMRNLKRHLFTAHKQVHPCPECPRVFQAALGMETHRREEHGYGIFKAE